MPEVATLVAEVREGGRLAPDPVRLRAARPPAAPTDRAFDKRGRELEKGDPILFAASGAFAGVYLGRYLGREASTGRMVAEIDHGEPRAGERTAIVAGATIRARGEDIRAEVRAAIAREIRSLEGWAL